MRLGPSMFLAGLGLAVAGILSSAADLWRPSLEERSVAIDTGDAVTLDIGTSRVETVRITARHDALLGYKDTEAAKQLERATWRLRDGVLLLSNDMPYHSTRDVSLHVPSTLRTLVGSELAITSEVAAPPLRVEARSLSWKGDAEGLDVHAKPEALRSCDGVPKLEADVRFVAGKVGTLRITMEGGKLALGDLSQVGEIALHVGPDVQLELARVADLPRIRVSSFDGERVVVSPDLRIPDYCAHITSDS